MLGRPRWLATCRDGLSVRRRSPLPELSNQHGSELSTLETDVYDWCYTLLVVLARYDDDRDSIHITPQAYCAYQLAKSCLKKT